MPSSSKKSAAAIELEQQVRNIATLRWGVTAQAEHIAGVNYDCILRPATDEIVAVEATCQNNADKLRKDINDRLMHLKRHYQNKIEVVRCYFVMAQEPSPSMVEYGKNAGVRVMSIAQFQNELLNYKAYAEKRLSEPFGSATDPVTGENDPIKYISVGYMGYNNQEYSIDDIIALLGKNKKIILLGEYGAGKSRCIHEVFKKMVQNQNGQNDRYVFCINLRENWGLDRKTEILRRHFADLGLANMTDAAIRISESAQCSLLLDGFDEIGIQGWSTNPVKIVATRRAALKGVADLIQSASGGVLITGRPQYFNSNKEMFKALGLPIAGINETDEGSDELKIPPNRNDVVVLRCPDEFTDFQMKQYLSEANQGLMDLVPEWVPKRPMIYNILINVRSEELEKISTCGSSFLGYWNLLIQYICEREARIRRGVWDGPIIFDILKEAAHLIFQKGDDTSHITPDELNIAFKTVTGISPDDDASVILQRLPGLGRVSAEDPDRQFTDTFLLNGLKASYFLDIIHNCDMSPANEAWEGFIGDIGFRILCDDYMADTSPYTNYLKAMRTLPNQYLRGILILLITDSEDEFDFKNTVVKNVSFFGSTIPVQLKKGFSNLTFETCAFGTLDITECTSTSLHICDNSMISKLIGIGNIAGKPSWIDDTCSIDSCQPQWELSHLRKDEALSAPQRAFISIIKKIFFQDWNGRQKGALLRGIKYDERAYIQPLLEMLKQQGIIEERIINKRVIYYQKRAQRSRMFKIQSDLTLSDDPIWREISQM